MDTTKKRGRKPKNIQNSEDTQEIVKKKRGRKPKLIEFKKLDNVNLNFDFEEIQVIQLPISYEKIEQIYKNLNKKEEHSIKEDFYNKEVDCSTKDICDNCININNNLEKYKIHDIKLLPEYINTRKIISTYTDISCWWCCHKFNTYPICAPISYSSYTELFKVKGCFCSFNCVKSYMNTDPFLKKSVSLIPFLYKKLTGNNYIKIKEAPNKEILEMFGGHISIEDYRQSFNTLTSYEILTYPMVSIGYTTIERKYTDYNYTQINSGNKKDKYTKENSLSKILNIKNVNIE